MNLFRIAVAVLVSLLSLPALAQSHDGAIRLAAPGFTGVNVSDQEAEFFNEYFSEHLSSRGGIKVTTSAEVRAVLGLERQKQLLGCEEDTSCLVEIAGALGVDGIVIGSVARFGDRYGINLKVIDARSSEKWAAVSGQVEAEKGVLSFLESAGIRMSKDVKRSVGERAMARGESTATASNAATTSNAAVSGNAVSAGDAATAGDASADKAGAPKDGKKEPEDADLLVLQRAAARHMFRVDVPIVGFGYEYRVTDFMRLGGRARLLGGIAAHSSGSYPFGADVTALVRIEPWMTQSFAASIHAGLGLGGYAWFGDDHANGMASGSFVIGAELIFGQVWRLTIEGMGFPEIRGGSIASITLGRAWLF